MPKATRREIDKSTQDAPEQAPKPRRCGNRERTWGAYQTNSPREPQGVPGAFGKALAAGTAKTYTTQGGHVKLIREDGKWVALGKQVAHGAGVRPTVRIH